MAEAIHLQTPLERALANLVRVGRVSSVDDAAHTVDVELPEIDGIVTPALPVLVTRPGDYSLPPVGALVVCLMIPGESGIGYVLGTIYSASDVAPLSDSGQRSIAGDDLRLGSPTATDPVALAPKVKGDFNDLKNHFSAVEGVITGPPIPEPGMGAPSALQAALAAAIGATPYPTPVDPAAAKVKAA